MAQTVTGDKPRIEVAAGIIKRDGRYLITKRQAGVHLAGLWEFPGGKRETHESIEECLARELREELGVEIVQPVHFETVRHDYPEKIVDLHFFTCGIASGEPRALSCEAVKWILPSEFRHEDFPPADRPIIDRLQTTG
ncbi:8-oxo-dGTP diphosphatase MutT [Candidatus Nitrospira bockiana]